jgi:hypothetical protein
MTLETGRDLVRGLLVLLFTAVAWRVDLVAGLVLLALMGLMILQSVFTGWCPADLFLRPLGLKSTKT